MLIGQFHRRQIWIFSTKFEAGGARSLDILNRPWPWSWNNVKFNSGRFGLVEIFWRQIQNWFGALPEIEVKGFHRCQTQKFKCPVAQMGRWRRPPGGTGSFRSRGAGFSRRMLRFSFISFHFFPKNVTFFVIFLFLLSFFPFFAAAN